MTKRKRFDATARTSAIAVFEDELKTRSDGYVAHLANGGKADCGEEFYLDALYMAISALREQPRWISVTERLPEAYKRGELANYLAFMPEYGVDIANYVPSIGKWCCMGIPCKVTHWMPLPSTEGLNEA